MKYDNLKNKTIYDLTDEKTAMKFCSNVSEEKLSNYLKREGTPFDRFISMYKFAKEKNNKELLDALKSQFPSEWEIENRPLL